MDGDTVLHDDTRTEEADAGDHLREDTKVVVVHRATGQLSPHNGALADQDKNASTYRHERVGGQAGLMLLELTLGTDKDTRHEGAREAKKKNLYGHWIYVL